MKTTIEKLGFKVDVFNLGIGTIYSFFDNNFGMGFSVSVAKENEKMTVLMPITGSLVPESAKLPQIPTSVETFNKDFTKFKNDFKARIHIEKDMLKSAYEKFVRDSKITSACGESLSYSTAIQRALSITVLIMGGDMRGITIFREDGAIAMLNHCAVKNVDVSIVYIEIIGDNVKFLTKDDDDNLYMKELSKDDYMMQFRADEGDVDNVLKGLCDFEDKEALMDKIKEQFKNFGNGKNTVVTKF